MPSPLRRSLPLASALLLGAVVSACGGSGATQTATRTASVPARSALSSRPTAGIGTVQLFEPLTQYKAYVDTILPHLRSEVKAMDIALRTHDVVTAKRDWLLAHLYWLQIGQDDGAYGAFGNLGAAIDGTAAGDVGGTSSRDFTGFHRVEYELYDRHDPSAASAAAAALTRNVDSISDAVVSEDLPMTTLALDAWVLRCHEILEDALRDTLSRDDDYGSHTGLQSLAADVVATREMLSVLSGLLQARYPGQVQHGSTELNSINRAIASAARTGGGYAPITALTIRARQQLNATVGAALETLSPVSEQMQISNATS